MAALKWRVTPGPIGPLTTANTQTILQVTAPANQRLLLKYLHVSYDGNNAALTPTEVRLYRQTTSGTGAASPPSPVLTEEGFGETPQATIAWKFTAEPTYGPTGLLLARYLPAYYGSLDLLEPLKDEIQVKGGGRLGVVIITPSGVTPNVDLTLGMEE